MKICYQLSISSGRKVEFNNNPRNSRGILEAGVHQPDLFTSKSTNQKSDLRVYFFISLAHIYAKGLNIIKFCREISGLFLPLYWKYTGIQVHVEGVSLGAKCTASSYNRLSANILDHHARQCYHRGIVHLVTIEKGAYESGLACRER